MALQNRVAPDGRLHATPSRGLMMGNRGGRLHDPLTRTLVSGTWRSRRWICCRLCFQNRQRTVMGEGYTELFFLDEVTALADGHRPCFECRREDARAFQRSWQTALTLTTAPRADDMDAVLHLERRRGRTKRCFSALLAELPCGTMIKVDGQIFALHASGPKLWSFEGYSDAAEMDFEASVTVLTPPSIIACLQNGYEPIWHPSARGSV